MILIKKMFKYFLESMSRLFAELLWHVDKYRTPMTPAHKDLYIVLQKKSLMNGSLLNLSPPKSFTEKINWLILFDQDSRIPYFADKLNSKKIVSDIDASVKVPFVVSTGNTYKELLENMRPFSGAVILKKNNGWGGHKVFCNLSKLVNYLNDSNSFESSLENRAHGLDNGEWHYAKIPPVMFVEEYIGRRGVSPPDFKFHCVNGRVKFVQYIYDRHCVPKEIILDASGQELNIRLALKLELGQDFNKPSQWEKMITSAEALSSGFKYVRIDLYLVDGVVYFGEFTFYPGGGTYKGYGQKRLGALLDIDFSTTKPPIYKSSTTLFQESL